MRNKFHGHFKLKNSIKEKIWRDGLFVFDANSILGCYRYSEKTCNEFLGLISKFKDRIWMPHRAAKEFFNNRTKVINASYRSYLDLKSDISNIKDKLKNTRHPHVSDSAMSQLNDAFLKTEEELTAASVKIEKHLSDDDILGEISLLFDGRVGDPYSKQDEESLCKLAAERYKSKIPPGFRDQNKDASDGDPSRPYGDYIIWEQTIAKAENEKKDIVFITEDSKDDWFLRIDGKILGPLPGLIEEFKSRCGCEILIVNTTSFIDKIREVLSVEITKEAKNEIESQNDISDVAKQANDVRDEVIDRVFKHLEVLHKFQALNPNPIESAEGILRKLYKSLEHEKVLLNKTLNISDNVAEIFRRSVNWYLENGYPAPEADDLIADEIIKKIENGDKI